MKYSLSFVIFLFSTRVCFSQQNLVPNPGLELTAPCDGSEYWIDSLISPWYNATIGTPDYFNSCQASYFPSYNVPNNFIGNQATHSGDGYAGIGTVGFAIGQNAREFIACPLLDSLQTGMLYCVEFYVSLAGRSQRATNMQAYLNDINPKYFNYNEFFSFIPQIIFPADTTISDTTNWVLVSGSFIAEGGEKFITIGNFFDDFNSLIDTPYPSNAIDYAYYYIDDVSVYECPSDTDTIAPPPVYECAIKVPTLIGVNEAWQIENHEPQMQVTIYNLLGQLLFSSNNYENDFVPMTGGVYLFELWCKNGTMKKGKIVAIK